MNVNVSRSLHPLRVRYAAPALAWLDRWLEEVRPRWVRDAAVGEVFVSKRGSRLTRQAVWYRIRHYGQQLGLGRRHGILARGRRGCGAGCPRRRACAARRGPGAGSAR